jgi:hypothetical protein
MAYSRRCPEAGFRFSGHTVAKDDISSCTEDPFLVLSLAIRVFRFADAINTR